MRLRAALATIPAVIAATILTMTPSAGAPVRAHHHHLIRFIIVPTTIPAPTPAAIPAPAPEPIAPPAPPSSYPGGYQPTPADPILTLPSDMQAAFACIRWRESRNDPNAQNPNSTASGLYQFLDSSWLAYGGGQFSPRAFMATPEQQGQVAVWAYQQSGLNPWGGGC